MKLKRIIYYLLIISILFIPKVNIISFGNITAGIRIDDILILVSLFLYLLFPSKHNKNSIKIHKKITKGFLIYFVLIIVSSAVGFICGYVKLLYAILYVARKFEYFVLFFIGYDVFDTNEKKIQKLFDLIVIFNFVVIILQILGIVGAISSGETYQTISGRYYSIFNGPYEMAAILMAIVPYYLLKIIKKENLFKSIILFLSIAFCIYMSGSRSSLVLLFVISIIMLFKEEKNIKKKMPIIFSLCTISIFLILFINTIISFLPRFDTLNIEESFNAIEYAWNNRNINSILNEINVPIYNYGDYSFNIRINKWMNLIDGFLINPLFGLGLSIVKNAADGAYIRLLVESGIIGFILWFNLVRIIFKIKIENEKLKKYINYSWLSLLLGCMFIDLFDASKVMCFYWLVLGLIINTNSYQNVSGGEIDESINNSTRI